MCVCVCASGSIGIQLASSCAPAPCLHSALSDYSVISILVGSTSYILFCSLSHLLMRKTCVSPYLCVCVCMCVCSDSHMSPPTLCIKFSSQRSFVFQSHPRTPRFSLPCGTAVTLPACRFLGHRAMHPPLCPVFISLCVYISVCVIVVMTVMTVDKETYCLSSRIKGALSNMFATVIGEQ